MTIELEVLAAARDTGSVSKVKLLNFAAKLADRDLVFAFEGEEDRLVWGVWIGRCRHNLDYEAFICDGKREARKLSKVCERDNTGLAERIWFFVDRDFDDCADFGLTDRIFQTDRYSIENYFVDEVFFRRTITEILPLNGYPDVRENLVAKYNDILQRYLEDLTPLNRWLHTASKKGVRRTKKLPSKISGIAVVSAFHSELKFEHPREIAPLEREITEAEFEDTRAEFESLNRVQRFRGKFLYIFTRAVIFSVCDLCRNSDPVHFEGCPNQPIHLQEFTLANNARHSQVPIGLQEFIDRI